METFLKGKAKIFVIVNGTKITVTDKRYPTLFNFLWKKWADVVKEYKEENNGRKYFGKPVKWYFNDESFQKLTEGMDLNSDCLSIDYNHEGVILKICNEREKKRDEYIDSITQ